MKCTRCRRTQVNEKAGWNNCHGCGKAYYLGEKSEASEAECADEVQKAVKPSSIIRKIVKKLTE